MPPKPEPQEPSRLEEWAVRKLCSALMQIPEDQRKKICALAIEKLKEEEKPAK